MKLRQRPEDFRVRELLDEGYLLEEGEFRVYRVTKRKVTTQEAARALAVELGVDPGDVSFAGLKDRQAVTVQYMSVPRGRKVRIREPEWKVEPVGFADRPLTGASIQGNAFEIAVRGLASEDVATLRENLPPLREHGLVNYFDDQRFGNLSHGQGWVARELMLGRPEEALRALLTGIGPRDNEHYRSFKRQLLECWGEWRRCRDVAGRFGEHHSVFEHLAKDPEDFAGAFTYVASRVRLIHLYAYQSHLWNRAVAERVRALVPAEQRLVLDCEEGPLVTPAGAPPAALEGASFRLPGEVLADVEDPEQRAALAAVLREEGLEPEDFVISGVSGFQLKGEDRAVIVHPRHLRVRPAEPDPGERGARLVRVRFELPRGAYATLVVKRLLAHRSGEPGRGASPRHAREREARGREERGRPRYEPGRDPRRDSTRDAPRRGPAARPDERGQGERRPWSRGPGEGARGGRWGEGSGRRDPREHGGERRGPEPERRERGGGREERRPWSGGGARGTGSSWRSGGTGREPRADERERERRSYGSGTQRSGRFERGPERGPGRGTGASGGPRQERRTGGSERSGGWRGGERRGGSDRGGERRSGSDRGDQRRPGSDRGGERRSGSDRAERRRSGSDRGGRSERPWERERRPYGERGPRGAGPGRERRGGGPGSEGRGPEGAGPPPSSGPPGKDRPEDA